MPRALKVVFDTNIFISAVTFNGNPRTCLELSRSGEIELFVSPQILDEIAEVLGRKYFHYAPEEIEDVIEAIAGIATMVEPSSAVDYIKTDPDDNKVLEAALAANADCIVSGDKKDLLSLKAFNDIPIMSSTDFLATFYKR